jgi:uncharacterized protein YbjT (DUF2867 family)
MLITGATGQTGRETLRALLAAGTPHTFSAGMRQPERMPPDLAGAVPVRFDFEDPATIPQALAGVRRVFLLRPPQLADIRIFRPLVQAMLAQQVREVVFLSVQGAEKSRVIPHSQIERLIREAGLRYVFLRPAYFMQNLTSTLLHGLQQDREIFLPAGRAPFNWVDVQDVGAAAAQAMLRFDSLEGQILELTGTENLRFSEAAAMIREETGLPVRFTDPGPLRFYLRKRREGMESGKILAMLMLHYLARFQPAPRISGTLADLLGRPPGTLRACIRRELVPALQG